jgi:hypothetical protein
MRRGDGTVGLEVSTYNCHYPMIVLRLTDHPNAPVLRLMCHQAALAAGRQRKVF